MEAALCRLESEHVRLNDLKAGVSVGLVLLGTMGQQVQAQQSVPAQQQTAPAGVPSATQAAAPQAVQNDTTGTPGLPQAPAPMLTDPLYLRDTAKDYTHLKGHSFKDPFAPYTSTTVPLPRLGNTPKLDDLMRRQAAALFDAGRPCGAEANTAKLLASEASWQAANAAMDAHGGYGFAEEYDIERKFRETRLYITAPVANNLILSYIGQHVLGMPRSF